MRIIHNADVAVTRNAPTRRGSRRERIIVGTLPFVRRIFLLPRPFSRFVRFPMHKFPPPLLRAPRCVVPAQSRARGRLPRTRCEDEPPGIS
jgi:hypothetical protein